MDSKVESQYFFFDESRRYGVVLDEVASAGKIRNENNKVDGKKLALIDMKTGNPIPLNKPLKDSSNGIASGDAILLEYL